MSLNPKAQEHDPIWFGAQGFVAAMMRAAYEAAEGINLQRLGKTPRDWERAMVDARRYLRGTDWEPMVSACDVDPEIIRQELRRRCHWMNDD